jgi:hypothetical protein
MFGREERRTEVTMEGRIHLSIGGIEIEKRIYIGISYHIWLYSSRYNHHSIDLSNKRTPSLDHTTILFSFFVVFSTHLSNKHLVLSTSNNRNVPSSSTRIQSVSRNQSNSIQSNPHSPAVQHLQLAHPRNSSHQSSNTPQSRSNHTQFPQSTQPSQFFDIL